MPNKNNILKPVTLVGFYRAGTTLMSHIFARRSDTAILYETGNIIHGTWSALEVDPLADLNHRIQFIHDLEETSENFRGRLIRDIFLSAYHDPKESWFHKPIGIPRIILHNYGASEWDKAANWYWMVFKNTFPLAKYFTILRNPLDLIVSARSRFGWAEEICWYRLALTCYFLLHSSAPQIYGISYIDLVQNPQKTLINLFEYLEMKFEPQVLNAFQFVDNPSQGREKLAVTFPSREAEWGSLNCQNIPSFIASPIEALFQKFDPAFKLPTFINKTEETKPEFVFASQTIVPLQSTIDQLHQDWSQRMHRNTLGNLSRISQLEAQIKDLKGKIRE